MRFNHYKNAQNGIYGLSGGAAESAVFDSSLRDDFRDDVAERVARTIKLL